MFRRARALAAFALLCLANPVVAQDADTPPQSYAPASGEASAACPAPARKAGGLGALMSAAGRAGAGDLLNGRSGQLLGSGKRGAIAGAVLGSALKAADSEGGGAGADYAAAPQPGVYGSRKAQVAAMAATAVIGMARAHAAQAPQACGS
ncbi:hypothetical protein [Phenylobacterium sp.]|uniref:hypothetical protein n=1 Tax=Phenylobacterium sp. TaxID=1871053 RepID=UPI0025F09E00|nr:hypothetical protein [Phenylobacterium sp.]